MIIVSGFPNRGDQVWTFRLRTSPCRKMRLGVSASMELRKFGLKVRGCTCVHVAALPDGRNPTQDHPSTLENRSYGA